MKARCVGCHRKQRRGLGEADCKKLEPYAFYFHGSGGGKFSEDDFRRICLWLDLNSMEFGSSIDPADQARQRAGEIVWPKIDFDIRNRQRLDRHPTALTRGR